MTFAALLLAALILDAMLGEPRALWDRFPHPAVVMGRAVAALDHGMNRGRHKRLRGVLAVAILTGGAILTGIVVTLLPLSLLWQVAGAAILLAQRSLADHVRAVADALSLSTGEGRRAVGLIVGRDTAQLDDSAIARAAIESAAENLSDGVVAPAFWFLIGGLPAMLAYKAINTADSMIGHRTPRHAQFGWAAARLDDLVNLVPARLTAVLIMLVSGRFGEWRAMAADARLHRSPNAGWPESAMARVLSVSLSGPRSYGGSLTDDPWVNPGGRRDPGTAGIDGAVSVLWRVWWGIAAGVAVLSFA